MPDAWGEYMGSGYGIITGHLVTLRRFLLTFWRDIRTGKGLHRRGGGHQILDLWRGPKDRGTGADRPPGLQDRGAVHRRVPRRAAAGLRAVPRPAGADLRRRGRQRPLHVVQHLREGLPAAVHLDDPGQGAQGDVVPLPEDFFIDMDVCMNCGLCSEYCPFDAIKMDQNFELSNYERHQTHIFSLQDLLVSSEFYAQTHPEAWASADEVAERARWPRRRTSGSRRPSRRPPSRPPRPKPRRAKPVTVEQPDGRRRSRDSRPTR